MRGLWLLLLVFWALLGAQGAPAPAAAGSPASPIETLRARIEQGCSAEEPLVGGRRVCSGPAIQSVYGRTGYLPVWTDGFAPLPAAQALIRALRSAPNHGLNPEGYHLGAIERLLPSGDDDPVRRLGGLADLELLLTDAFLLYGAHLLGGRVDPETIDPEWVRNPRVGDVAQVLVRALASGRIEEELEALAPRHPEYDRLRKALARYRTLAAAGGWRTVPAGPKLREGSEDARVAALRERLLAEGYAPAPAAETPTRFDRALAETLREFQRRNGLEDDGVLGPATLTALNVTAEARVRQIEANLERWRWLPADLGLRHLRVNIAGFDLQVWQDGRTVLSMAVVVGKPATRTPVFSSRVTDVVFNPTWTVPAKIAREEMLPAIQKQPGYLAKGGYRVFRGYGARTREVDPGTVSWASLTPKTLDLWFRQDPGPANALGRIKFLLPNRFDVYLHDTPSRSLFAKSRRLFSHGCIRVQKPLELAEYLLGDDPSWTRNAMEKAIQGGKQRKVPVPEPIPVHLLYTTAWVDEDGTTCFREDAYDRDDATAEALLTPPPPPAAPR